MRLRGSKQRKAVAYHCEQLAMAVAGSEPDSSASIIPTSGAGIAGAFVGLGLAVRLARRMKRIPQGAAGAKFGHACLCFRNTA
jgi:uncharacterized protein (TIGR03382 family)